MASKKKTGNNRTALPTSYQSQAQNGGLNGQDPDGFVSTGGVPAIDISNHLWPGMIQTQISLVDTGGFLASSTLYLVTNCTNEGITGPGQITGNPIPSSDATNPQLAQNYPFNSSNNQQIQFTYDLSQAQASGTLTIPNGSTPSTANLPLTPATFPSFLKGTSFATSNCLVHTGELLNGSPACEPLYPGLPDRYKPQPERRFVPGLAGTQRDFPGSFRRPQLYSS